MYVNLKLWPIVMNLAVTLEAGVTHRNLPITTLRSSLHAGERTVRHARAELMREQQTTTHTLTNTLNTLSLTVRAQMLRIRGLKVLGNTQMFCIIEFHFIDLSLRIFNTKFVLL
jgi:hypothetical protein